MTSNQTPANAALPVLPLRDVVVYPNMVIPLFVGREKSIRALDAAMDSDKQILLVAQRSPDIDDPEGKDLYEIGTVSTVLQLLKLPDGTIKVLVEGVSRARAERFGERDGFLTAHARPMDASTARESREVEAASKSLMSVFEQYVKLNRKVPPELLTTLAGIDDPSRLADTVAAHLGIPHYTFDRRELFQEHVIAPFVDAYLHGETPSPCVACNRSVKLRELFPLAERLGAGGPLVTQQVIAARFNVARQTVSQREQSLRVEGA